MNKITDAYSLAYEFIPGVINMYNEERVPLDALLNTDLWYSIFKKCDNDILLDWCCVKAEYHEVSDELSYVFYTFPEPKVCPEAKYAIAVIRSGDSRKATYYTLEYSIMYNSNGDLTYGGWVLGGMDGECHNNYGSYEKDPTKENFIDTVLNFCKPTSIACPQDLPAGDDEIETDVKSTKNIVYGLIAIVLGVLCILIFSSHLIFWAIMIVLYGIYLIIKGVLAWVQE